MFILNFERFGHFGFPRLLSSGRDYSGVDVTHPIWELFPGSPRAGSLSWKRATPVSKDPTIPAEGEVLDRSMLASGQGVGFGESCSRADFVSQRPAGSGA